MKRVDIKKILIIGSGPILIGQASEFDYSGTQAIKSLKEEGYTLVLINSNPATIMTDPDLCDCIYIEPLTVEFLKRIVIREKPDAILPTLGGQTALNLTVELSKDTFLADHNVEILGADLNAINKAENRRLFKKTMLEHDLDVPYSIVVNDLVNAPQILDTMKLPLILRPSFTLGGSGSSIVYTKEEFYVSLAKALEMSPINEVLIEESILGWKEFELEVVRDSLDNCIVVCSIENLDPMGVHTGDSITVSPIQTLTDKEYQKMRDMAFRCIRAIGVKTGGSNIQFAVHPKTGKIVIIEMNPRVSRSSALSSKATGFPIAKVAAKLAVGYNLPEIKNDILDGITVCFEPVLDYCIVKIPRFAFEKFSGSSEVLTSQMKSVGEVMSFGKTFSEALQKSFRALEIGCSGLDNTYFLNSSHELDRLKEEISIPSCKRIFRVKEALVNQISIDEIYSLSGIDSWFLRQIEKIVEVEKEILENKHCLSREILLTAKQNGFSDRQVSQLVGKDEDEIRNMRKQLSIIPQYSAVDSCSGEFPIRTSYFYATYSEEDEVPEENQNKVLILGGGPNRIGQGIEFDYCSVHAVLALKDLGYKTIMINCNPETVSTDYDVSNRLYFEPVTYEDVMNVIDKEKPVGVMVQFGGQTPLKLTLELHRRGIKILGTSPDTIDIFENREKFKNFLHQFNIFHPRCEAARSFHEAFFVADKIGYPIIVRPSYVLGGRGMMVIYNCLMLETYLKSVASTMEIEEGYSLQMNPILIDQFLSSSKEVDVDILSSDGEYFIAGIMEHIEEAGIHSGDSACVLPPKTLTDVHIQKIKEIIEKIVKNSDITGFLNIQFAIQNENIYILEINPRASRTIPFVSKSIGIPLSKVAARIMMGEKLNMPQEFGYVNMDYVSVKESVIPWDKFPGSNMVLSPEMHSTGEVMGIDENFFLAFYKSQAAVNNAIPLVGKHIFLSLNDVDKERCFDFILKFFQLNYQIFATSGTYHFFLKRGIQLHQVRKIHEGHPNILDSIKNGTIDMVINTPTPTSNSISEGFQIRHSAIMSHIPIFTTFSSIQSVLESIIWFKEEHRENNVETLQSYQKRARRNSN